MEEKNKDLVFIDAVVTLAEYIRKEKGIICLELSNIKDLKDANKVILKPDLYKELTKILIVDEKTEKVDSDIFTEIRSFDYLGVTFKTHI